MPHNVFAKSKSSVNRTILILTNILILIALISTSCLSPVTIDDYYRSQISQRACPYAFNYVSYHFLKIAGAINETDTSGSNIVFQRELIERISGVLREHGIPVVPPLNISIEQPPYLLVVSPREKIEYFDRKVLRQDMSSSDINYLESSIDELGLSSLVANLGGFGGTYPPIIADTRNIRFIIDTAIEEWLHQYLVFKPLGFLYLLDCIGIRQDPDVITINETAVGIISREIGQEVYYRYYYSDILENEIERDFNFDEEMRETRRQVDILLESGQIDEAERYMEARRQYFLQNGYYIRKLNQAYFAFHGIYGDSPAAVSPVYEELENLRAKSSTLKDFIDTISTFTSYNDLIKSVKR